MHKFEEVDFAVHIDSTKLIAGVPSRLCLLETEGSAPRFAEAIGAENIILQKSGRFCTARFHWSNIFVYIVFSHECQRT